MSEISTMFAKRAQQWVDLDSVPSDLASQDMLRASEWLAKYEAEIERLEVKLKDTEQDYIDASIEADTMRSQRDELAAALREFIAWFETAPEGDPETSGKYAPEDRDDIHCVELSIQVAKLDTTLAKLKGDECPHCGAGDENHHSFTCPTGLHPDQKKSRQAERR